MDSTACGEPSPTACLIERGTGIPGNAQRWRSLDAEKLPFHIFSKIICSSSASSSIYFPKIDSGSCRLVLQVCQLAFARRKFKLTERWGSSCIRKIALDRWKTCALSGRSLPGKNSSTGWRKQRNGENSRNLPILSSKAFRSSSIGARNPAITELERAAPSVN